MATFEIRKYLNKKTGKVTIRYKAKIRLKGFPHEEATFDRLTDAKKWAADREYQLRHQQHFGPEFHRTKTLTELIERYEQALIHSNPKRYKDVSAALEMWKDRIGKLKLCDLSQDTLVSERDRLKTLHVKGNVKLPLCSNSRVNRVFGILKCALNVAVTEWRWLPNPLAKVCVYSLMNENPPYGDAHWIAFRDSCRFRGIAKAIQMQPKSHQHKLKKAISENPVSWWAMDDDTWKKAWHEALKFSWLDHIPVHVQPLDLAKINGS